MTAPQATLYDVRYSRFTGQREPRWRSVLVLAQSSASRALGIRRPAGAKVWPFFLLAAAYLPVVVGIGIPLLIPGGARVAEVLPYQQLLAFLGLVIVAFTTTTVPSLLTRERRDRVLSLFFSTALSPLEYVAGKVLAALFLMCLVTLLPC